MADKPHRIPTHLQHFARKLRLEMTWPEVRLWQELKSRQMAQFKFRKQAIVGGFIVDFYCPSAKLVIEVDGETHDDPESDVDRDKALAKFGLQVVRYTNDEVVHEIDWVLQDLWQRLTDRGTPSPTPP